MTFKRFSKNTLAFIYVIKFTIFDFNPSRKMSVTKKIN